MRQSRLLFALQLVLCQRVASSSSAPPILQVPADAWRELNSSVSGLLFAGQPSGLPCYDSYNNSAGLFDNAVDEAQCQEVRDGLTEPTELIDDFGSYFNPAFATCIRRGEGCALSPILPIDIDGTCHQGTVPNYYVDAREVLHVQRAISFAREYGLSVTVKNTGHDFIGRSTGVNTLAIWYEPGRPVAGSASRTGTDAMQDAPYDPRACNHRGFHCRTV
jgi:hypothetical protein